MNTVTVQAPSSKSVSHRMLIGAALAAGTSEVSNLLESRDLERTADILRSCGADIVRKAPGQFTVRGVAGSPAGGGTEPVSCDVHESGTTCRLLTAVLAGGLGKFRIHGAPRMHERPIGELTDVLQALGTVISFEGREGYPPFVMDAARLKGGDVTIGLDESSQYLSGLLLVAPLTTGLTVTVGGSKVVSWPYVGLTLQALADFGLRFTVQTRETEQAPWIDADWKTLTAALPGKLRIHVSPGMYRAGAYRGEGDWSGASYLLAAGAIGPRPVRVTGLRPDSLQGDRAMLDILARMGAGVDVTDDGITITPAPLKGIEVDMGACPDLVPTVAAVAAFATGRTVVRNVAHLRIKESDRIAAPAMELRKAGIMVEEHDDGLTVTGGKPAAPAGTLFSAHGDHRIAMSAALLAFAGVNVQLDDTACVGKSFPDFWERFTALTEGLPGVGKAGPGAA